MPDSLVFPPARVCVSPGCPLSVMQALAVALPDADLNQTPDAFDEVTDLVIFAPTPHAAWPDPALIEGRPWVWVSDRPLGPDEQAAVFRAGALECLHTRPPDVFALRLNRCVVQERHRKRLRHCDQLEERQKASLKALASSIPGLILHLSLEPDQTTWVRLASKASFMLLGLPPEDLQEGPDRLMACVLEEDRPFLQKALRESAASLKPINWEGRIRSSCGDIKWINLRATAISPCANGQIRWEGVMWNITQSKQTESALRKSREQLAAFSAHLEQAKEEERERIARDIHDVLGGHLVAIRFELSFLLSRLSPRQPALKERALSIQALVDDAIATVSRVTRELRPGILKDFGLLAALECQAEDFFQRTGILCKVTAQGEEPVLPEPTAIAFFRAFQETLTNVVKHAHASCVQVSLVHEPGLMTLSVEDNGVGIKPEDLGKPLSFGLRGLRERLSRLGGDAHIETAFPQGTRVALSLSLKGLPSTNGKT